MRYEPLASFPAVRTHDVDELRQRMSGLFAVRWLDLGRGGHRSFEGRLNHRQMQDVGVSYARYGCSFEASVSQGDSYLQGFPVRGQGTYLLNGIEGRISRGQGINLGPGETVRLKYSLDFEHLILRINPQRLVSTLSGLIDRPIDPPLVTTNIRPEASMAAAQHRLIEFVAGELDRTVSPLPGLVLAELEQILVLSFLNCNFHNYSHFLREDAVRSVAPWQVRLAQEYIEQNWNQPITIEALAVAAKTSTRSLFYSFKKSRGVSPMTFARQVRLRHAHEMLMSAGSEANVTSIAAVCGFSNPGHFARHYNSAFGEHPSITLKKAR